jgi:hypothetical protein
VDVTGLQQDLVKQLATMAVGQGGDPDVYSAELSREQMQAAMAATSQPSVQPFMPAASDQPFSDQPDSDLPDSDQPDPA